MIRCALLCAVLTGCTPLAYEVTPAEPQAAVALAWVLAGDVTPIPTPSPTPDDGESEVCWNCNGTGEVGDGRDMLTCTICNGTGKLPKGSAAAKPEKSVLVEPEPEPAPRFRGYAEAVAEQARTGRPIIVVVRFSDEKAHKACGPCRVMSRYLEDPENMRAFSEFGIPAVGHSDEWQKGPDGNPLPLSKQVAPMLCYVPDASDPTTMRQTSGRSTGYPRGFVLSSADEFLQSVRLWLDGT